MITNFKKFLNEWYTGPYSASGFKTSEPNTNFTFSIVVKYNSKNRKLIKEILDKYNILYDKLDITGKLFSDTQKIDLIFKSYNKYEASSIVNTILEEFQKNNILFDPSTIAGDEENKPERPPKRNYRDSIMGFKY